MQPISARHSRQLAALKVLIVDDESAMRKVTRSLLHGDYYEPEPRKLASHKPEDDPAFSQVVMIG